MTGAGARVLVQNTAHISNKYGFQAQSATATGRGPLAHSRLCHEHLYLFLRIKSGTGRQRAFGGAKCVGLEWLPRKTTGGKAPGPDSGFGVRSGPSHGGQSLAPPVNQFGVTFASGSFSFVDVFHS